MNLIEHLERQKAFSEKTFGPGQRTQTVIDHIHKELAEIEANPTDLEEWIDVVLLALDGAWRAGYEPHEIADQLSAKLYKNEVRAWPDWRLSDPNKAIEHIREPLTDDALQELLEQDERDKQFLAEHGA
jgi:tagatose-1,6-bisphosphate aldolase non-catalytic subunit AgaZ/GatZ